MPCGIETDQSVGTPNRDHQVFSQNRGVVIQIDVRLAQERTKIQDIRPGIEAGDLIHGVCVQDECIGAGARQELDCMAAQPGIDQLL